MHLYFTEGKYFISFQPIFAFLCS